MFSVVREPFSSGEWGREDSEHWTALTSRSVLPSCQGTKGLRRTMWSKPPPLAPTISVLFYQKSFLDIIRSYGSSLLCDPASLSSFNSLPILHIPFSPGHASSHRPCLFPSGLWLRLLLHSGVSLTHFHH